MNATAASRPCPICGSTAQRLLFQQRFGGDLAGSLLSGYDVVACTGCGFCYADGLPPQVAFDTYYANMSKYEHAHEEGREGGFEQQRFPTAAAFIRSAVSDPHVTVLDIGCSNGGLLAALSAQGFDHLLGMDPSPECRDAARRHHGLRVLRGTLSAPAAGVGSPDLVLLSAVLEHVRDLRQALQQVRRLLVPNGLLYVEVPDATRFGSAPDAPFQEFSVEHVNYFSRCSLRNLLASAGFDELASETITTIQGENAKADVIMAVFRCGDLHLPHRITVDAQTERALIAYTSASATLEAAIHAALDPIVASGQPILVWGVGTHTQRLLAEGPLGEAVVVAFVDSNPRYQGKQLDGLPVLAPTSLTERKEPILISSRFYQAEITRTIREDLRLPNELILLYRL